MGALTGVRTGKGADLGVLHSLLADRHAFDPVLETFAANHRVTLFTCRASTARSRPCWR